MEPLSLLMFWHRPAPAFLPSHHSPDVSDADDDDGDPSFDLVFDVSEDDNAPASSASEGNGEGQDRNGDVESGCQDDSSDCTSDDDRIFFEEDILPISPSIDDATALKTAPLPVSLLKSSALLRRILISSLKKPGNHPALQQIVQRVQRFGFDRLQVVREHSVAQEVDGMVGEGSKAAIF